MPIARFSVMQFGIDPNFYYKITIGSHGMVSTNKYKTRNGARNAGERMANYINK